eukprot:scaffold2585_cov101-Alexandrium_tamarense.AAC.3
MSYCTNTTKPKHVSWRGMSCRKLSARILKDFKRWGQSVPSPMLSTTAAKSLADDPPIGNKDNINYSEGVQFNFLNANVNRRRNYKTILMRRRVVALVAVLGEQTIRFRGVMVLVVLFGIEEIV